MLSDLEDIDDPEVIRITNNSDGRTHIGPRTVIPSGESREVDMGLLHQYYRSISALEQNDQIEVEIEERRTVG